MFALTGKVNNTGLVEVPMGITLRDIIFDIGGGIPEGKKFKAVQTGGPLGGCMPTEMLDTPVDYDSLTSAGATMGSGGMIVVDEDTCMVEFAKFFLDVRPCRVLRPVHALPNRRQADVGGAHPHHRGYRHDAGSRSGRDPGQDHGGLFPLCPGSAHAQPHPERTALLQGRVHKPHRGQEMHLGRLQGPGPQPMLERLPCRAGRPQVRGTDRGGQVRGGLRGHHRGQPVPLGLWKGL